MDMKEKFLKCFREDMERKCEWVVKDAREGKLPVSRGAGLCYRWTGMLDMALDLGFITCGEYGDLIDVVLQIRMEAIHEATRREPRC